VGLLERLASRASQRSCAAYTGVGEDNVYRREQIRRDDSSRRVARVTQVAGVESDRGAAFSADVRGLFQAGEVTAE